MDLGREMYNSDLIQQTGDINQNSFSWHNPTNFQNNLVYDCVEGNPSKLVIDNDSINNEDIPQLNMESNLLELNSTKIEGADESFQDEVDSWNNTSTFTDDQSCSDQSQEANLVSKNKRGRPKAALITTLIIKGSKSHSNIKCKFCNRVFPREKSLQAHLRTHTGERPYTCDFPSCKRAFTQSGQLKTHQRLHTGEKPFQCSNFGCDYRFAHANRRCPHHPNAALIRCVSAQVLRPVETNPLQTTEVAQWLEKYRREKKVQSLQESREEVENNVYTFPKTLKQRYKEQSKKQKALETECDAWDISNIERKTCSIACSNSASIQKADVNVRKFNLTEQRQELPKKRWLREASLEQTLRDLNESRPTVLMLAGKENESRRHSCSRQNSSPNESACSWESEPVTPSLPTKLLRKPSHLSSPEEAESTITSDTFLSSPFRMVLPTSSTPHQNDRTDLCDLTPIRPPKQSMLFDCFTPVWQPGHDLFNLPPLKLEAQEPNMWCSMTPPDSSIKIEKQLRCCSQNQQLDSTEEELAYPLDLFDERSIKPLNLSNDQDYLNL